jgi:signal transduction histidine kinase
MMLGDVDRLSVFVDDILEASRISHGRRTQSWTAVSVSALLQRSVDSIRRRYNLDDSAIAIDMATDFHLQTDPTALETIIKNLLDNAVKYSGQPPRVTLSVRLTDKDQLEFAVTDEGIGIAKSHLKRIFKRFYRVPSDDVYARSGTGLGLYVVAALVRNLGGRIEARSSGEHRGASVLVRLPLTGAAAEPV